MSCRPSPAESMAPRRVWAAIVLAAMIGSVRPVRAQGPSPDVDMLLNLDLFTQKTGAQGTGSLRRASLVQQIKTLQEMGAFDQEAPPTPSPGGKPDSLREEGGGGQSEE